MKQYSIFGILICAGLYTLIQIACTKTPVMRQLNAAPRAPNCDTCTNTPTQVDKELILYLTTMNWVDMGNGRYECDLIPLVESQGIKTGSTNLLSIFVGLGRDAIKLERGNDISYAGGSLVWFGYKLNLQLPIGTAVPQFLAIRLELEWL